MKLKWFEAVKYMIALTKLLSHFSKVNHARKVKADQEVTKRNTKVLSLSKYQFGAHIQKKKKVYCNYIQRESIKVVDGGN